MKKFFFYAFICLITSFLFACSKNEDIIETEPVVPKEEVVNNLLQNLTLRSGEGLDLGCFTIRYPFGMTTIDGNTIMIHSDSEYNALAADTSVVIIDFAYPLQITKEGENLAVGNIQELAGLFASCIPQSGWTTGNFPAFLINEDNSCYKLVYPVGLTDINGAVYMAGNEAELSDLLAAHNLLFFRWPLTLQKGGQGTVQVQSSEELLTLLLQCDNISSPNDSISFTRVSCFDIVFPIQFENKDGEIFTAENGDQVGALLLYGDITAFHYPITLYSAATGTITVCCDEELNLITAHYCCNSNVGDVLFLMLGARAFGGNCYDINYPVSIKTQAATYSFHNDAELETFFNNNLNDLGMLVYPLSVTLAANGAVKTFNSFDELSLFLLECS